MRAFDELIELSPFEMSPEEQAYLYETLKNILSTKGQLDPQDRLAAPELSSLQARRTLPEFLEKLQAQAETSGVGAVPIPPSAPRSPARNLLAALPGALGSTIEEGINAAIEFTGPEGAPAQAVGRFMEGQPIFPGAAAAPSGPAAAPAPTAAPALTSPVGEPKVAPTRSMITSRRGPNGQIIFTNVDLPAGDSEAVASAEKMYRSGLTDWREKAQQYQAGLAPLEARVAGIAPTAGRTFGDFTSTGKEGSYIFGGDVPAPQGAPKEWGSMSPLQRDQWMGDQAAVAGPAGAALDIRAKQAKVADLEDPVGAAMRVVDEITRRANEDPTVRAKVDAAVKAAGRTTPLTPEVEAYVRMRAAESAIEEAKRREQRDLAMSTPESGASVLRGGFGQ